jgi:predicted ArsR family transcriptional regulator
LDFFSAKKLGACLARDYAEDIFRLLVNYRDISASETASRLNLHIRTAQDFLETLASVGVLAKQQVFERKRPYFRYSLVQREISLEVDLGTLFSDNTADAQFDRPIRERKSSKASFSTARSGKQIASLTTWTGSGRDRKSRKINLTAPQGRFLYHLPFPTGGQS